MSTINTGDQPYEDRHNTPPTPAPVDPFQWVPPVPLVEPTPWRPEPMTVGVAIEQLEAGIRHGTDVPYTSTALRLVLDELRERMTEDVALSEPTEGEVIPNGLHYFLPHGAHVTDVARWASDGHHSSETTLDLRVLAAHLTTALDGINAELDRRL